MSNDKLIKLEDFDIYKTAMEIGEDVWNFVIPWDSFTKNTIGNQIVRSADSIAANIAEGYGRFSYKERKRFCYYSRGSLIETKTWLTKAAKRQLITTDNFNLILSKMEITHKMLNSYIKTLKANEKNGNDEY